jgi:hypothetical protein
MKKEIVITLLILISSLGHSQNYNENYSGLYEDLILTKLSLNVDGTFDLEYPDPVFPYTMKVYKTKGIWISSGNEITLNPKQTVGKTEVKISESKTEPQDSVILKINYSLKKFKNDELIEVSSFEFDQMTIFVNKKKNYYNLVRGYKRKRCAFAPTIKNQIIVDSSNTFKITKEQIKKIGIMTYGFDQVVEFNISDPKSNLITIDIIQPVDVERSPKNKKVIIKGNTAYFHERKGKVDTSFLAMGLQKVK